MNIDTKKYHITNVISDNTDYKIIAYLTTEIIKIISNSPVDEYKEKYVHEFLYNNIHRLTASFNEKLIFVYDEIISVEILTFIHTWFSKQSCDIENIIFISTHTLGMKKWYNDYLKLYGSIGFKVIEATWMTLLMWESSRLSTLTAPPKGIDNRKLKHYFSYYGGTRSTLEQDALTALVLTRKKFGSIEYMGKFKSDPDQFDAYLEQITNFKNRELADQLLDIYKNSKLIDHKGSVRCEGFTYSGTQWEIDSRSLCQILRETATDIPYSIVTEKTFRTFIHFQIPMPLSGINSVENLESLGFKFCHDLIDYSYQYIPNFITRVQGCLSQINTLANNHSLGDLEEYILNNKDIFWHNYDRIASRNAFDDIKSRIIKELND